MANAKFGSYIWEVVSDGLWAMPGVEQDTACALTATTGVIEDFLLALMRSSALIYDNSCL